MNDDVFQRMDDAVHVVDADNDDDDDDDDFNDDDYEHEDHDAEYWMVMLI